MPPRTYSRAQAPRLSPEPKCCLLQRVGLVHEQVQLHEDIGRKVRLRGGVRVKLAYEDSSSVDGGKALLRCSCLRLRAVPLGALASAAREQAMLRKGIQQLQDSSTQMQVPSETMQAMRGRRHSDSTSASHLLAPLQHLLDVADHNCLQRAESMGFLDQSVAPRVSCQSCPQAQH